MRVVVQRVTTAKVTVSGEPVGEISRGLLVFLGVGKGDTRADMVYLADKIAKLRVFEDENGKMNLCADDAGGDILCVSQFTLYGDCRKGNRPGFSDAALPEEAEQMYHSFCEYLQEKGYRVETGRFGASMQVLSENDGPVTLILDSKN